MMKKATTSKGTQGLVVLLLVFYALFAATYFGLRYGWRWIPGDAQRLTDISRALYDQGSVTRHSPAYQSGFGYPALNTFLAHLSGLTVEDLQVYVQPFLIALLVVVAFMAYRSLTGTSKVATLAVFLLFLQPEFLFEVVRSSHAKFTLLLALGLLYALAASFNTAGRTRQLVKWSAITYLLAFGLISSNAFFASNYIFGIMLAFIGWRALSPWMGASETTKAHLSRLIFIGLSCIILVFLFIFYLYPPALRLFVTLETIQDQLMGLYLEVETTSNPYNYIVATWLDPRFYLVLTLSNWSMMAISFVTWLILAYRIFLRRQRLSTGWYLVWLMYASFACLMVISVLLDVAGVLSSNLQLRVFPNFMIFAIPLASYALVELFDWLRSRPAALRWSASVALGLALLFLSAASFLKVSNEPLLSNYWMFYTPSDRRALVWTDAHTQDTTIWVGLNLRLKFAADQIPTLESRSYTLVSGDELPEDTLYFLSTRSVEAHHRRVGAPLPNLRHEQRVYDSGEASLYKVRARTPYQR